MVCKACGKQLPEGASFCTNCGQSQAAAVTEPASAVTAEAAAQTAAADIPAAEYDKKGRVIPNPLRAPAGLTKKEFFKEYSKTRSNIVAAAIIGYVAAGLTLFLSLVAGAFTPLILVDVAILLVTSLLLHLIQSRVCAIILLAYSAINCLIGLIVNGQLTGWLIIIAGVFAVIGAFAFHKEWAAYQERTAA